MRILFCNKYNYPFSGTEVYLFELMELMRAQGHEVALFSMADPRGEPTPYDQHFVSHIDFKARSGWLAYGAASGTCDLFNRVPAKNSGDDCSSFGPMWRMCGMSITTCRRRFYGN